MVVQLETRSPRIHQAAPSVETTVVTVILIAAQLEADDAIHVAVADTDDLTRMQTVVLPAYDGSGQCGVARQCFIAALGQPSYEGRVLLYGTARLTLADARSTAGLPQVLELELLGTDGCNDAP